VSGVAPAPEGITNPPIDELLERTSSKYGLVIFAAKRARQINAYYSQLSEGLLEYVGPLVDTAPQEKPLSIALREINEGLLTHTAGENQRPRPGSRPELAKGGENGVLSPRLMRTRPAVAAGCVLVLGG
jgi:DNA-directed RNA polymerase subunit omega